MAGMTRDQLVTLIRRGTPVQQIVDAIRLLVPQVVRGWDLTDWRVDAAHGGILFWQVTRREAVAPAPAPADIAAQVARLEAERAAAWAEHNRLWPPSVALEAAQGRPPAREVIDATNAAWRRYTATGEEITALRKRAALGANVREYGEGAKVLCINADEGERATYTAIVPDDDNGNTIILLRGEWTP